MSSLIDRRGRFAAALPALSIVLLVVLVYGQSLSHQLVWDDEDNIVHNPALRQSPLSGGWLASPAAPTRLLTNLSFAVEYRLWGLNPAGYHATNLALHVANSLLVMSLVMGLSGGAAPLGALAAGWLFAVHPVNVEAVNSIALGRGYLLAALFGLTALRLAVAAASPAGRRWWWGMAIGVATLAFLSHEIGAVAVLLMAVVWLQGHDRRQVWLRRMGLITAAATGLVVALLLPWLAGGARGLYASLEAFSTVAVLSIKQLFVPVPLCLWFDATAVGHAALKGPAAEIALTVALLLLGLTYAGRADCLWRSVLLMVLSLSPVLARHLLPFPLPSILGERWLYLPAAFLAIWAGFLAQSWRDGMGGGQRMAVKLGAGVLLAALMSAGTSGAVYSAVESRHWRDNVTLFEHATQHCPPSAYLRAALGKAYYDRGQMADATAQLLAAAAIDPTFARARIGLGLVALESGRLVDALRELTAAIELAPSDSDAHNGLGELYFRLGRSEAAIHEFQLAVAIRPWHVVYRWNLALALMKADRLTEALAQWERVLAVSPDPGDQATAREEIELLNRALAGRRGL